MEIPELTNRLKDQARQLGFALCGACPAVTPQGLPRFWDWLAAGYDGQMHYLAERRDAYQHPSHVLPGARSLLMLGMHYRTAQPPPVAPGQGRVSRYAWGTADYHDVIHQRLKALRRALQQWAPHVQARGVVDTAPLLEREFAELAGLGWVGKHTLLLQQGVGSWFFLAALLVDCELDYDPPQQQDHCGSCTACLDACPTQAFPQPFVLDARRCISYLTIELQAPIPPELRPGLGDWLFGCDVCQDVCPWNRFAPESAETQFQPQPDRYPADLVTLLSCDEDQFRNRFRRTPLWRAKRRGLLRNAAIVLGNQRLPHARPALIQALDDPEPWVRGAAAWALGQYRQPHLAEPLRARLTRESDGEVRHELQQALEVLRAAER